MPELLLMIIARGRTLLALAGAGIAVPATLVAQTAASIPSVTLPPELDRVLRDYERAWKAGQTDSVAQLFLPDGHALPSGKLPARGRSAIAAAYAGPGGDLRLRAIAFEASGTAGYIIGLYRYGNATDDMGKFLLAVRKVGDRWMIAADMDNSLAPRRASGS